MADLTPELRKALEAVPDEWAWEWSLPADVDTLSLEERGLSEMRCVRVLDNPTDLRWEIRRTPAGRAALGHGDKQ